MSNCKHKFKKEISGILHKYLLQAFLKPFFYTQFLNSDRSNTYRLGLEENENPRMSSKNQVTVV